ncbi:MAG: DUF192 domain-containing protein [Acidobacteria bacterium]|nr:MAG: DUF192 domain-containing protein [Acidobacteriota bacterium]
MVLILFGSMQAINVTRKKTLADVLSTADTIFSSLIGLLGKRNLPHGAGLWLVPCQSIHTMWMRFPIDVIFLDSEKTVVHLIENMKPFRISIHVSRAKSVIELPAHTITSTQTQLGDQIEIAEE